MACAVAAVVQLVYLVTLIARNVAVAAQPLSLSGHCRTGHISPVARGVVEVILLRESCARVPLDIPPPSLVPSHVDE